MIFGQRFDFSLVFEGICPVCKMRLESRAEEKAGICPKCLYGFRVEQIFPEGRLDSSFCFTVIPPVGWEFTSTSITGIQAAMEAVLR